MRLLLDTHVLIWTLGLTHHLPLRIKRMISGAENEIWFSAVSIFEIAAKRSTGRRNLPPVTSDFALIRAEQAGFTAIGVSVEHAAAVEGLALSHADPFDRLLLAQARVEGLRLVTHDERLAGFDDTIILF